MAALHEWTVTVEASSDGDGRVTDEAVADFLYLLEPYSAVVVGGGGHETWGAVLSLAAQSPADAGALASQLVTKAAEIVHLPAWPLTRVEVVRGDVLDEELAPAELPDLSRSSGSPDRRQPLIPPASP